MNKMEKRLSLLKRSKGFTLIEMMLVMALIALLVGAVAFNAGNIFGGGQRKAAELAVREGFKPALFSYRMDMGNFPTTEQGLRALLEKPGNDRGRWRGPYVDSKEKLRDPWDNEYKYRFPSTKVPGSYELYSLGPDGQESEDDITSWAQ